MRSNLFWLIALALFICPAICVCATPKSLLFSEDSENMTFHFGKAGAAKVSVSKGLSMDGYRAATLTPILTEVVQERLQARGFTALEAKPSAGGWSQLNEFKLNGKTLILEIGWNPSGNLTASGGFYTVGSSRPVLTLWTPNVPAVISQHYPDAESFYHGVKKDITPIVDDALSFIINDLSSQGMPSQ